MKGQGRIRRRCWDRPFAYSHFIDDFLLIPFGKRRVLMVRQLYIDNNKMQIWQRAKISDPVLCNCGSGCQENELEGTESNQFKDEETTIVVITNRDKSLYCNGGFFFQGIVIHNEDLRHSIKGFLLWFEISRAHTKDPNKHFKLRRNLLECRSHDCLQ